MATLKDIAKETGLAVGTVSRVLNNRGYISADTKNKVNDVIKKLNYRPNEAARSLHGKRSGMIGVIGVIVPHIRHPYFSAMISSLEDEAGKRGYRILLCGSGDTDEKRQECFDVCRSNQVAGIIFCGGSMLGDVIYQTDIPIIFLGDFQDTGTASVECDHAHGGELAAEKLISCGCKYLLHVGSSENIGLPVGKQLEGFRKVCQRKMIPVAEIVADKSQYDDLGCNEQIEQGLLKHPEADGIFADTDMIAARTLQICHKLHISVPGQMKVIGYNDMFLSTLTTPRLTTIHQPVNEMAELALNLLQDALAGKLVPKRAVLPVCLVERESTG